MGYRFVFSQMFDVRPRTLSGDLDLEKIKKIEAFLDLKIDDPVPQSQRIINLRPKLKHLEILNEKPEQIISIVPAITKNPRRKIDFWPEFFESNIPDESEILSVFDIIEATEQLLKESEAETAYSIPIKNIIEAKERTEPAQMLEVEEQKFDFPQIEEQPLEIKTEQTLSFENENLSGREPDLSFWSRAKLDNQPEFVVGNQFLTPEFLLGKQTAEKSFRWGAKKKSLLIFLAAALIIFSFIPLFGWINKILIAKNNALNSGFVAYQALTLAKDSLEKAEYFKAEENFKNAYNYFAAADSQISDAGGWLVSILEKLPGFSYISSRTRLIKAGQDMSKAGQDFTAMIGLFQKSEINFYGGGNKNSLLDIILQARNYLESGLGSLISAKQNLDEIKISALSSQIQPQMVIISDKMPQITESAALALDWIDKFMEILGNQKAKKYLLVFQNNAEARATGGFIGTYGLLDLDQGQIKNLFIDGIFNADGQLREKIIPPPPIQKISTAWSMHDANWFADFPTSAQKLMWFCEKTGGPTVDGVISLTPTVIENLLELTGPIDMPEYEVSLNAQNFVEITQYKVEVDYNKELNQPKKILTDFAPKFMEKIGQELKNNNLEILKIINQAFKEKHILVYFSEPELQEFVKKQGWAGEILPAQQDYFSVVNANINGYKTDKMIDETIKHSSQILEDGSIIDTLEIIRHHLGGNSQFDWFNKVNSDYLRVYLPKGSQLIWVSGQTKEENKSPIDYQAAGFRSDSDVAQEEQSLKKDEASGTDIFEESGKTVFGNWVYVSPGETVTLIYQYRLPFRVDIFGKDTDFSLLAQKQSGSPGSKFETEISWSQNLQAISLPGGFNQDAGKTNLQTDLTQDRLFNFKFSNAK